MSEVAKEVSAPLAKPAVYDLRSALDLLKATPGQLVETDVEVDPSAELAGVYRYVGAGGTVARQGSLARGFMRDDGSGIRLA